MHISHQYFTALGCAPEIDQVAVSSFYVYCFDSRIIQELLPLSNGIYFCATKEMSTSLVVSGLIVASLIAHHRGRVIL